MTLTISMAPDLESRLRNEAARLGLDESQFVLATLEERLDRRPEAAPSSEDESNLLRKISNGPASDVWQEYRTLVAKRREETLTEVERRRLLEISDQIEAWNTQRVGYLAELARLRGIAVPELMEQLGIRPPDV